AAPRAAGRWPQAAGRRTQDAGTGANVKIARVVVLVGALLAATDVQAQDQRAAMRETAQQWQAAIVNVRVSLKVRMSMGGREVQSMDDTVEAVATVIDPGGLTVMSLSSLDPGAMMSKLIGGAAQGDQKMTIESEPSDVRIRLADGKE